MSNRFRWRSTILTFYVLGNMKAEKQGFTPISKEGFIESYLKSNPEDSRLEIESAVESALDCYRNGMKCHCGSPIWVVGSAVSGAGCFTCITGEAKPDSDYEIDEAI